MRLHLERIEVAAHGLEVAVGDPPRGAGAGFTWSIANRGDVPLPVRSVSVVYRVETAGGPLRCFRHGYQSWSPTGVATFGVDEDPSRAEGSVALVRAMHHADQEVAAPGELRSEAVTVLADGGGTAVVAGFLGGDRHDGTFRLRPAPGTEDHGRPELWCEAFLGGAVVQPGERRELHAVTVRDVAAEPDAVAAALEAWAARAGAQAAARTSAPYQVGWCSWYHYFHGVSEADVDANLALADRWPFDVFQVDDGYQPAIGDWLRTNDRFPSPLDGLAGRIAASGRTPGIWLAPFVVAPDSEVARQHPDWIARWVDGDRPLVGMWNDAWGGAVLALDTTRPEVLHHLEGVARDLVDAGFPYLKLDFTYAPATDGVFADPSMTPAQRVRAGYDAIRSGAGDATFLLGCGAPLAATVGVVDGMRIGPDVAPWWDVQERQWRPPGYEGGEPATVNAWRNTLARSFLHRRWWLNDPDCLMLRTTETAMSETAVRAWAGAVAASGGMALVSDDLALLGPEARSLLDEVVERGREADGASVGPGGHPPRCPDLLDTPTPTRLEPARGPAATLPAALHP